MIAERFDMLRRHEMAGQLVRFGVAGVITTVIYALVYLPLTVWVFPRAHAVYAVPPAFVVAVTAGFFLHSRWSFRGRSETADPWRHVKFVAVQGSGVLLNALVTWIGTAELGYPGWVPLLPAIALATTMTFILNRQLVFR